MDTLPPAFLQRMQQLLGDEFKPFLESYQRSPSLGLRINPLKISPQDFLKITPFPLSPVPWCPTGFVVQSPEIHSPGKHPYHAAGLYYIQEPSAMIVAELLNPQPGERVLDLAAAPGGKTTHLAALMKNEGLLIANEIRLKRIWGLVGNLERWGVRNTVITNESPPRLVNVLEGFFDKVLLDAPCSGEGMFRKDKAARLEWSSEMVHSCAIRQTAILNDAARLVRPGGMLVYSTCTFAPEENEGVIAKFLMEHPYFELVAPPSSTYTSRGRPEWVDKSLDPSLVASLAKTVRLWPHHGIGEGHFVAILQRVDTGEKRSYQPAPTLKPSLRVMDLFRDFCHNTLKDVTWITNLAQIGERLYQIPAHLPALPGLRIIHPGLWLGSLRKNRFEPSHALSMCLTRDQVRLIIQCDYEEAIRYLRGETLHREGEEGWVLVTIDNFPLGWGKRTQGIIKNFYPKALRWL